MFGTLDCNTTDESGGMTEQKLPLACIYSDKNLCQVSQPPG